MRGMGSLHAAMANGRLRDVRDNEMAKNGRVTPPPKSGIEIGKGRKFRCNSIRDGVIVYFLQRRRAKQLTPAQKEFSSQSLPHLGLVTKAEPPSCCCRLIHDAMEQYFDEWRRFKLNPEDRVRTLVPEKQTLESIRHIVSILERRIGHAVRRFKEAQKQCASKAS